MTFLAYCTDELLIEQSNATASDAVRKRGRPSNSARAGLNSDPRVRGGVPKSDATNGTDNGNRSDTNFGYEGGSGAEVGTISCSTATLVSATKRAKKEAKTCHAQGAGTEEASNDENCKRDKHEAYDADKLYAVQFGESGAEADNKRVKYSLADLAKFLAAQGASGLPSGFKEGGHTDDELYKLYHQHK
jgi:hypothetical protein